MQLPNKKNVLFQIQNWSVLFPKAFKKNKKSLFILRKQESASQKHDNQKLQDRVHINIQTNAKMWEWTSNN